jgi:hypothetical protein
MEFKAQQELTEFKAYLGSMGYRVREVYKDLKESVIVLPFALRRHMTPLFQKMDPVIFIRLSMLLIVELRPFTFEMVPIMKLER